MKASRLTTFLAAAGFAAAPKTAPAIDLDVFDVPPPSIQMGTQVTGFCARENETSVKKFASSDYSEFKGLTARQSVNKLTALIASNPWGAEGHDMKKSVQSYIETHKNFLKEALLYCPLPTEFEKAADQCGQQNYADASKSRIQKVIKSIANDILLDGDCMPGSGGGAIAQAPEVKTAPGKTSRIPARHAISLSTGLCSPSTSPTTPNPCY